MTELADNDIKLAIREWKTFGISLEPLRGSQPGYSRILARNVEQSRRQVESCHRCARPRGRDRNDTCAGSNVEHGRVLPIPSLAFVAHRMGIIINLKPQDRSALKFPHPFSPVRTR